MPAWPTADASWNSGTYLDLSVVRRNQRLPTGIKWRMLKTTGGSTGCTDTSDPGQFGLETCLHHQTGAEESRHFGTSADGSRQLGTDAKISRHSAIQNKGVFFGTGRYTALLLTPVLSVHLSVCLSHSWSMPKWFAFWPHDRSTFLVCSFLRPELFLKSFEGELD